MPSEQLDDQDVLENSKVSETLLLMKLYSLSSCVVNNLLIASDGTELDIPYELTKQEEQVICFPRSDFILGRSGTWKTTVLTVKLIQKEQQHYISSKGTDYDEDSYKSASGSALSNIDSNEKGILRKVLINVSPKLCSAISGHIYRLKSFVSGGDSLAIAKSTNMLDIGVWKHSKSEGHEDYGLLVSEKARKYAIVKELDTPAILKDGTTDKPMTFLNQYSRNQRILTLEYQNCIVG